MRFGRLQVFNNWSPFTTADQANVSLGLEYFCKESDEIWKLSDERMVAHATEELSRIGEIPAFLDLLAATRRGAGRLVKNLADVSERVE